MDHKAEAVSALSDAYAFVQAAKAFDNVEQAEVDIRCAKTMCQISQAEATLALVEEQRTANLIAFYEMDLRRGAFDAAASLKLFSEIRDRLGLS